MAKTIEQMAIDYGHKHMGCCDIEDFEAGANAVLQEIESCLGEFYSPDDYKNIKDKIKELKGE